MKITLIRRGNKEITGYNKENWLRATTKNYWVPQRTMGTTKICNGDIMNFPII